MEPERKSILKRWKLPRGSGFYFALCLAVIAMGLVVWGTVNSSLRGNRFQPPPTTQAPLNWQQQTTQPIEPETQPVMEPVQDVPDDRAVAAAEATTEATTAARTDNLPFTGDFALPFGTNIVKDFSHGQMVRNETMGDWRVHNGVDFGGQRDQEVLAIQDGIVLGVTTDPLWGVVVSIDHGHGIIARYAGLTEGSTPREGREVAKGEAIGVIGQVPSESSGGSVHLHFEITVDGVIQDPLAVMNRAGNR